jgi:hypothetical protein
MLFRHLAELGGAQRGQVMRWVVQQRLWFDRMGLAARLVLATFLLAASLLGATASQPAAADGLSQFRSSAGTSGAGGLDAAAAQLKTLAGSKKGPALAATVGQEGHWTFVNQRGEKFTAASPEELKRVVATLVPGLAEGTGTPGTVPGQIPGQIPGQTVGKTSDASAPDKRLTLLLTEDAVFDYRSWLKDLPQGADLRVVVDNQVLPLLIRGDLTRAEPAAALFAEIRRDLFVAVINRAQFDEVVWQLNRPLTTSVRVLALEPGGPATLGAMPKLDATSRRPLIDRLDPLRVAEGIKALRGQTAIVVGRVEGKLLVVQGSRGPEQSVIVSDLVQAAEASDVNLVMLQSASARQPGARNWFWQASEVAGLETALARAQVSDLLSVLGAGERPLTITPSSSGATVAGRVTLTAMRDSVPARLENVVPMATDAMAGAIDDLMSGLTGKVTVTQAQLHLQSRQRATALQGRLVPSVPTGWIEGYVAALLLGLLGWRWTSAWWQRLWPQEARGDYAGVFGFRAAQAARAVLMMFVYLPVAGLLVLPVVLISWFKPASTANTVPPVRSPPASGAR